MKTILIAILLISIGSCKDDRYIIGYDVKVETFDKVFNGSSPNPGSCASYSYVVTVKRGNSIKLDMTACKSPTVRIKVSSGKKKVWYDKTQQVHKETIEIK